MTDEIGQSGGTVYKYTVLAGFVLLVFGVGTYIGLASTPDGWYAQLIKPAFNPPTWIFAPVWLSLYVLIAYAGWRIWLVAPRSIAMALWWAQQLLNWLWTPVFFSLHLIWPALAVITVLLALIGAFIWQARRHDVIAAYCFVPYFIWVGFATVLNLSFAILN